MLHRGVPHLAMTNVDPRGAASRDAVPPTLRRAVAVCVALFAACASEMSTTQGEGGSSSGSAGSTTGESTGSTTAPTTGGSTEGGATEGGSTEGGSTEAPTGSTGEPGGNECACIVDEPGGGKSVSLPTCGADLCDPIVAEAADINPDSLVVTNPEALDCVLTALRDRTPGIVRWSLNESAGVYLQDGYILIQADGTIVRRWWGVQDLAFVVTDAAFGALPEPATFAACLDGGTDWQRFDCAVDFDPVPPILVCDAGWVGLP